VDDFGGIFIGAVRHSCGLSARVGA
jgi:hypothetical protein